MTAAAAPSSRPLNADRVSSEDRRAVFVGTEAYVAAGGHIIRDLFGEDGAGFFDDAALLNRLVNEKLAAEAEAVRAEGWKWIEVVPEFDYGIPAGKLVHAILDNYAAHKTPEVRRWLANHPRWTFHFTPTSSSWLNAVEGFFAKLTRRRLKRGVFRSVVDLQAATNRLVDEHNQNPKPFVWRANPDDIIAVRARGFQALESIH